MRNEIDFSSAQFILNHPVKISQYRRCPEQLVQKAKTGSFEFLFYPVKGKNKETQFIIIALMFLLRTWKTLQKRYHINSSKKLDEKNQEIAEINFRVNNRFNFKTLTDLLGDLAQLKEVTMGMDPYNNVINPRYDRLFKKNNENIVLFREIPEIYKKLYEYKQSNSVRPVFIQMKGSPRQLSVGEGDSKLELSHDQWVKDSQKKSFRRYLVRAITPQERGIIAEAIFFNENIILIPPTEVNREYLKDFKENKHRSSLRCKDDYDLANSFKDPEVKSGLLVLDGKNKFAFCCSDTLKEAQILSNRRKSFINDGQTYVQYIQGNGQALPGWEVQGGGQIIIDCGLIPQDVKIIAVRANFANPTFLDDFRSNTALKIKWVSYRNHEVHLSKLPISAIIAWRSNASSAWLNIKKITAPLYRQKRTTHEQPLVSEAIKKLERQLPIKIQLEQKIEPKSECMNIPKITLPPANSQGYIKKNSKRKFGIVENGALNFMQQNNKKIKQSPNEFPQDANGGFNCYYR